MISRKYCWVIRRYNGSHPCTRATISQDHSKLDTNTIADAIKPVELLEKIQGIIPAKALLNTNGVYRLALRRGGSTLRL
ncbi:hypothetical protein Ahy_A10g047415 [Arachis hypogaea]|uniref:Uncharacterized protein n=1 Tax=Arachis hypogaea TaxID=3818 RepID=A0A445B2J8_ARAHY|nr:hypothetical protein Ahy_A10g047415 [Arachis hypogaea]